MTSIALPACAAVLWSCTTAFAATQAFLPSAAVADGPSLAEMSQLIEEHGGFELSPTSLDLFGTGNGPAEGRGKKPKPGQMAMAMMGAAGASMMMMKAMTAIKLFIIHSFLATKLGLIIGAYLLVCKLMEMKQMPPKKIKWVSPPSHDEHPSPPMMMSHYPDSQSSYEPHQEQMQQQMMPYQPPADQYGPPPAAGNQQQFMPSSDFNGGGGGGDMHGHYSHISPVTYRPMLNRNQSADQMAKSTTGRVQ